MSRMHALSVWQPYASLLAVGAKHVETRHWPVAPAVVGRRVAIHAGKNPRDMDVARTGLFKACLDTAADEDRLALVDNELPLGYILATATLAGCEPMGEDFHERYSPQEIRFGWFAPGRWAWHFDELSTLAVPIPYRGAQGVFLLDDETTWQVERARTVGR